jgi:hypothetical protein
MTSPAPIPGQRWVRITYRHTDVPEIVTIVSRDPQSQYLTIKSEHRTYPIRVGAFLTRYDYLDTPPQPEPDPQPLFDARPMWEVRQQLEVDRHEGTTCPCCDQYVKVYHRKLTAMTARILIEMWVRAGQEWVWLPSMPEGKHGDTAKARYWGLIEAPTEPLSRPDGSTRVGWWRLTDLGAQWVRGEASVPAYALVYNGQLLELDGSRGATTVRDALGTRFNYTDLMEGK